MPVRNAIPPRVLGLCLGYAADYLVADPRRWDPVAGFGRVADRLEERMYADSAAAGTAYTAVLVGSSFGAGLVAQRLARRSALAETLLVAGATCAVLRGTSLVQEANVIGDHLVAGHLDQARARLREFVARVPRSHRAPQAPLARHSRGAPVSPSDIDALDRDGLARVCIRQVARDTTGDVVAPLLWGGLVGVPGLLAYRAASTLDARVGDGSGRYHRFGVAAARLDEALTLVPERVTGLLARPPVWDEPAPHPRDVARAARLARSVMRGALVVSCLVAAAAARPRRPIARRPIARRRSGPRP